MSQSFYLSYISVQATIVFCFGFKKALIVDHVSEKRKQGFQSD